MENISLYIDENNYEDLLSNYSLEVIKKNNLINEIYKNVFIFIPEKLEYFLERIPIENLIYCKIFMENLNEIDSNTVYEHFNKFTFILDFINAIKVNKSFKLEKILKKDIKVVKLFKKICLTFRENFKIFITDFILLNNNLYILKNVDYENIKIYLEIIKALLDNRTINNYSVNLLNQLLSNNLTIEKHLELFNMVNLDEKKIISKVNLSNLTNNKNINFINWLLDSKDYVKNIISSSILLNIIKTNDIEIIKKTYLILKNKNLELDKCYSMTIINQLDYDNPNKDEIIKEFINLGYIFNENKFKEYSKSIILIK